MASNSKMKDYKTIFRSNPITYGRIMKTKNKQCKYEQIVPYSIIYKTCINRYKWKKTHGQP